MELIQTEENGIVRLKIKGRLDADSAPEAEKAVKDIIAGDKTKLLFDMSELDYTSSAGLRVILMSVKELRQKEGKIVLCSLNEYVHEVFEVSNFASIIPITKSIEDGIEQLS